MKTYNHIISALGICHKEFAYSFDGYKKRLKDILEKEDARDYVTQLKSEIKQAQIDPEWSWKEAARQQIFAIMTHVEVKKRTLLKLRI